MRGFSSEKGGKPQEYFVYFKVFGRISGGKDPSEYADVFVRYCLKTDRKILCALLFPAAPDAAALEQPPIPPGRHNG